VEVEGGERRVRQAITGSLHVRVLAATPEARVGFRLAGARVEVEGDADRSPQGPFDSPPFVATIAATGEILEFEFPPDTAPRLRELLAETVRTFQCVVPAGAGARWRTEERHATGTFVANYRRDPGGSIRKTKSRYLEEGITVTHAQATFRPSSACWIDEASLKETVVIESKDVVRVVTTTTALLSASPGEVQLSPADFAAHRMERWVEGEEPKDAPPEPPVVPTREEVEATVKGLVASGGENATAIARLRRQLVDGGPLDVVVVAIAAEGTSEDKAAALIGVLGFAGTPEAQEALASILRGAEARHSSRLRAAVALGLLARPGPRAMESLWAASEDRSDASAVDVSNTALLALGTATGALRDQGSPDARSHRSRLVERLHRAADGIETEVVLKSLGNTRDTEVQHEIAAHLEDPSYAVRTAAAYAMRTMRDPVAADRLAARLEVEADPGVRQALASSLSRLGATSPAALRIVHARVASEPDEGTRCAMADILCSHMDEIAGCRATLERLLATETSDRIRKRIAEALHHPRREGDQDR
jgi:HEAT repeat protein